jgi:hypothetical protein
MAADAEGVTQAEFVIDVMQNETKDLKSAQAARKERRKKRSEGTL